MSGSVTDLMGAVMVCTVVMVSAGVVSAAGPTAVDLGPTDERVSAGTTVDYEVVVANASRGVGSVDATVAVNDSSVATIENITYRGNPSYANQPAGGKSADLSATGMDTLDSGRVQVATVTVRSETAGTVAVSITVSALGDENGSSYSVTETQGRTLTVESDSTDEGNGGGGGDGGDGGDGGGGDDGGDGDDSDGGDGGDDGTTSTPTSTATPTATPVDTQTPIDTQTEQQSTESVEGTDTVTGAPSTATGQSSPTTTASESTEGGSLPLLPIAIVGVCLAGVGAVLYYRD
ncbi:hypothetical protein NDI56_16665 [Haloarcula sp. S1CR25-12]|uniref:PGF-CTERM sorting domain-containing protein n=1 Tax=Haloarcula saliterrae TaxID=2950534 RepID=A0ABU2FFM1_9EURY|nr:hypothetical protein [Haloarcula sp. S1CR25-12]MDS0261034.1 hypothetical protein [Haloarcula sp. S1CR25-12]